MSEMPLLTNIPAYEIKFFGPGLDANLDGEHLTGQLRRTYDVLKDGRFRTLRQIEDITGDLQSSISARFRQLGELGFDTEKKRDEVNRGLWWYRIRKSS